MIEFFVVVTENPYIRTPASGGAAHNLYLQQAEGKNGWELLPFLTNQLNKYWPSGLENQQKHEACCASRYSWVNTSVQIF